MCQAERTVETLKAELGARNASEARLSLLIERLENEQAAQVKAVPIHRERVAPRAGLMDSPNTVSVTITIC